MTPAGDPSPPPGPVDLLGPSDGCRWVSADGSQVSREVYFSDDIFEVERANIFQRCWLYVGHESQVPAPGDYITSWMGEEPVILVRGTDHALQVLVNSCSHRGTRICRAHAGTATSFTCPYHGWQFGTDGDLRGVPHLSAYGGTLDKSAWGLHRAASVDSVFGLVFATFDPEAAPLASFLGGDLVGYLETVFQRDDAGIRVLGGMHRWKLDCNWKVPVENHAPDMIHVDPSHRSAFAALGTDEFTLTGSQITTAEGHMFAARYLEADAGVDERLPGHGMANFPAAGPFLRSRQPAAERRLGPVRSRLAPIAATVFPNLSVVPTKLHHSDQSSPGTGGDRDVVVVLRARRCLRRRGARHPHGVRDHARPSGVPGGRRRRELDIDEPRGSGRSDRSSAVQPHDGAR